MQMNYNFLVGKTLEEFRQYAVEAKIPYRIIVEEGRPMMLTSDSVPYRITATIVGDVVTKVQLG